MAPEARKFLWDALRASDFVAEFTDGRSFEDYAADPMLRSAVERQFEIVGEALAQLGKLDPALAGGIPDLRRIVGFRNILAHGYSAVDDRVVWGVVEGNLPSLRACLRGLLGED